MSSFYGFGDLVFNRQKYFAFYQQCLEVLGCFQNWWLFDDNSSGEAYLTNHDTYQKWSKVFF